MKEMKTMRVLTSVLFVAAAAPGAALAQSTFAGFANPILIETGKVPYHVKAMDLDSDGDLDLVVANRGNFADLNPAPGQPGSFPSIEVFRNNGQGVFTSWQVFNFPLVKEPRYLATGDLDGDGLMDMVVADGRGNRIVSFVRAPGGGFELNPQSFPVNRNVMSVDLGQINGDILNGGDTFLDAVTGNYVNTNTAFPPNDPIGRLSGDGTGNFGRASLFNEGSEDPTAFVSLVDRDKNGVIDQAVSVQFPFGAPGGTQTDQIGEVTLTDVDANAINEFGGSVTIYASSRTAPIRPTVVHIDDLDSNTIPDIIIPSNGIPSTAQSTLGQGIFIAFDGAHNFNMLLNSEVFTNFTLIPTTAEFPFDVAIGDVNGDATLDLNGNVIGNKDLVVTHWNTLGNSSLTPSDDLSVLIYNGSANNPYMNEYNFTFSALPFPNADNPLKVSPRFVELFDIDGDGDLDILTTRTRNGGTMFTNQPNGHIAIFRNLSILNADLNGDGVVDAADLAILLVNWGSCTCFSNINGDVDGVVNAADLAILLVNWTGGSGAMMAQQGGGPALGDSTVFKDGSGTSQPNQNISAPIVPWVVAHFGFDSVASYTSWLDLLTEEELFNHIAAVLDLIAGN